MTRFLCHIIHAICFKLIRNCVGTAGFSLGEISALVFSGALTYEEGLHIIRVRAEAMQKACDEKAGAMVTVFLNPGSPLKLCIAAAINHCEVRHKIQNPCCKVANYLYPDCKVIAGNKEVIRPVRWEQTMYALYDRPTDVPFPRTIEAGPGRQLGAMLRMVSRGAFDGYSSIDV
ncbi:unnamed protein product [Schistosoma mattheei]|uniref:Malonyl-CoA:ACP transacylase (MAT) domain-containing protein n=1 Tax=Schistosoma mattheei TaxID=31246 RepID=A0AA85BHS8_9TREM|nr:unnamed protein product [Schistosoma mattheei]